MNIRLVFALITILRCNFFLAKVQINGKSSAFFQKLKGLDLFFTFVREKVTGACQPQYRMTHPKTMCGIEPFLHFSRPSFSNLCSLLIRFYTKFKSLPKRRKKKEKTPVIGNYGNVKL